MTLDPASAVAASLCWLARWRGPGAEFVSAVKLAERRHPRECDWCVYPPSDLLDMIAEHNREDLIRDETGQVRVNDDGQPLHRIAGRFHALPRNEQRDQVAAALYSGKVRA